jgi:hypothetical protein
MHMPMADDILILSSISYTLPGRHLNRYDAYFLVGGDIQTSWPTLSEESWVICAVKHFDECLAPSILLDVRL